MLFRIDFAQIALKNGLGEAAATAIRHLDEHWDGGEIASRHHEKLDGSGYPNGFTADQLPLKARIIAVADIYGALSEERPYRASLNDEEAFAIMEKDVPKRLDQNCFDALQGALL